MNDSGDLSKNYKIRGPKAKVPREELRSIILNYAKEKKTRMEPFYLTNSLIKKLTGVTSNFMMMRVRTEIPLAIDGIIPIINATNKNKGKALFEVLAYDQYQVYQFSGKNFRYLTDKEVKEIISRIDNLNMKIDTRIKYRILVICDLFLHKSPRNLPQIFSIRNISEALLEDSTSASMIVEIAERAKILYITPDRKNYCLQNMREKQYDPSKFNLFSKKNKDVLRYSLGKFLKEDANEELKRILDRLKTFTYQGRSSEVNLATMLLYTLLEREELYSPKIDFEKESRLQELEIENNLLKKHISQLEQTTEKLKKIEDNANILKAMSEEIKKLKNDYDGLLAKYNKAQKIIGNLNSISDSLTSGFNKRLQMLANNIMNETTNFQNHKDEITLRMNCISYTNDTKKSLEALVKSITQNIEQKENKT